MLNRYLLYGVVSFAALLIVAAIIIAGTAAPGVQSKSPALAESTANSQTSVAGQNDNEVAALDANFAKAVLAVEGMSCSGCVYQIKSSLAGFKGIRDVIVDVSGGRVDVFYDSTQLKDLKPVAVAITDAGYPATLKQTMTSDEIKKENNRFAARSKLYIAAVGDWEISRSDFDAELSHARTRYEKTYGGDVFSGGQGKALWQRLQSQVATNLISEGIQMQEVRKAGFKLPAKTVEHEFNQYLSQKGATPQQFEQTLKDNGYEYDYFFKKFENRLTIDRYLNELVLAGLSNDLEMRQKYSDWYNNARLLAKVEYYDKNLEKIVKNNSAGSGCGSSCSAKQ